jgi:predicted O-linked N-acetylglucosamine transferase (SPINDLY family)
MDLYQKALGYYQHNEYQQAACLLDELLSTLPNNAEILMLAGINVMAMGQISKALDFLEKSTELDPENHLTNYNYANTLLKDNQREKAIAFFQRTIELKPDYLPAINNLADIFKHCGRVKEAEQLCLQGIESANDNNAEIYNTYANILTMMGCLEKAIENYHKALSIAPDKLEIRSNLLLAMNYTCKISQDEIFKEHLEWDKHCRKQIMEHSSKSSNNRKIRLGYVSGDFRRHSVAFFIEPLIFNHDREKFEIFCYSDVVSPDDTTERIKSMTVNWRDISGMSNPDAAKLIKDDNIEILIDLAGHTGKRLEIFSQKPAPIQITYLGYPNTSGLSTMDFRLTDQWADPVDQDKFYTEKLIRLPNGFQVYAPPGNAPEPNVPPHVDNGFFTFGSFNNFAKITMDVIRIWAAILRETPGSRLMLKNMSLGDPFIRDEITQKFKRFDIAAERLVLNSFSGTMQEHLECYNQIDLALDTFPFNGATTTCESLWMGVPVLTLIGNQHACRVGYSLLNRLGLNSFAAKDKPQYLQTAVYHATNPKLIHNLKNSLRSAMAASSICNGKKFALEFENTMMNIRNN